MHQEKLLPIPHNNKIYDYEYEVVPTAARKSWYIITLIWLAIGIDVSGLFLGSFLSDGLTFSQALLATLIGSSLLGTLGMLCADVGYQSGLSTTLLSTITFGRIGGKIVGIISALSLLSWFAFQLDFFGDILQKALYYLNFSPNRFLLLLFGTIIMTSTAIWGVRALGKLSLVSVPFMLILIIMGLITAFLSQPVEPPSLIKTQISMGSAISYVISIWIISAVISPDIARYAKSRFDALVGAGLGFLLGNSSTIVVALILTKLTGSHDLVQIFFSLGLGVSAIVILVLAQWTTNSHNLISASLGLSVVFSSFKRPILVIIMATIGLGFAHLGMIENFTYFLSLLGVLISPIAGVYLSQHYLIKSYRFNTITKNSTKKFYSPAIFSWIIGCLTTLLTSPDFAGLFELTTVPSLDGILIALICYFLLDKIKSI